MFVIDIEEMLVQFYENVVQYLKNWEKPTQGKTIRGRFIE